MHGCKWKKIMGKKDKVTIAYLREVGFREQMAGIVEPYLKKYKRSGMFLGYDKTPLHYRIYVQKHARGNIVISHGFSEFAEKYNEMIFYFLQAGYSVFFVEHRGHGRSQRKIKNLEKVYVKSFEEYVWDLRVFVKKIVACYSCQKEMILFAHSMGGAIGALYLEKYPKDFQKAILSAPMIQMRVGNIPYPTSMRIANICRLLGFGKTYAAGQHGFADRACFEVSCCLSEERHLYAFAKRLANRKCQTSGATYSWVCAAAKASEYVQENKNIQKIKIPVLLFSAGKEHMVNTDEICRFAAKLQDARLVWILGAKHEIFNAREHERLQFYQEIFNFLGC